MLATQLRCVSQLVRIEPNPTLVDAFLRRALELFLDLEQAGRWQDLVAEITAYNGAGGRTSRTQTRCGRDDRQGAQRLLHAEPAAGARRAARPRRRRAARSSRALTRALGPALVPGFVALIDRAAHQVKARAFTPLMCELAPVVADALLVELESCGVAAARVIVKVLGYAGAGHEAAVARLAQHSDAQVAREALRSLARMGTASAAAHVARQIRDGSADRRAAAEDALWHFPPAQTATQLRELLRSREFVMKHPQLAARLIERAGQAKIQGLADVLTAARVAAFQILEAQPRSGRPEGTGAARRNEHTATRCPARSARRPERARQPPAIDRAPIRPAIR